MCWRGGGCFGIILGFVVGNLVWIFNCLIVVFKGRRSGLGCYLFIYFFSYVVFFGYGCVFFLGMNREIFGIVVKFFRCGFWYCSLFVG